MRFFVCMLLLVFGQNAAWATIRYQDIADQTLALGQFALFDLTGDGSNDLAVTVNFAGGTFIALSTPTIGTVGSSNVQTLAVGVNARKLGTNFFVGPSAGTYTTGLTTSCSACVQNAGDWVGGATDAYIGFRFTKTGSGTVHYGWLRVAVNSTVSTITIKELAYETNAAQGLNTGFVPLTSLQIQGAGGANTIAIDDATLQIVAQIAPANATVQSYTWTSDNPLVATVDANGLLTARADGNTLVRAEAQDGTGLWDTVRIFVSNQVVPVAGIIVSGPASQISTQGGTLQLGAQIAPTYATNPSVFWSVDDEQIATIDASGLLTAHKNGQVLVVATALDGSRISGSFAVQVSGQPLFVEAITLQGGTQINSPFGQLQFTAALQPSAPDNPNIIWSVSDNSIAGITNTGLLQAYANGQVTVTAEAADGGGAVASLVVDITNQIVEADSISIAGQGGATAISTDKGTLQLSAVFSPSNTTNTHVRWAVDNPSLATINAAGLLTARRNGVVTAMAIAQDGSGVVGQAQFSVSNQYELIEQLQIAGAGGQNSIGTPSGTLQMEAIFAPTSATNQNLVWTVTPASLAHIDAQGLLTADANGAVTVTAISQDGSGLQASTSISITGQPILTNTLQLQGAGGATSINTAYGTLQIVPTFAPSNASNQNLVWTVDNPAFAVVDENGVVTALQNGSITITATTQDGSGVFASISLMLTNQPISLNSLQIVSSRTTISIDRDTLQLSTLYAPTNATNTTATWHSSNPQIATVSNMGILSAVGDGVVTITALAQDGSGAFANRNFTISNQNISVSGLTISAATDTITSPAGTLQMLAAITPANATNTSVFWQVDSSHIASINALGQLLAHSNGMVRVTATAQDGSGAQASRFIFVRNQPVFVQSISITARTQSLNLNADTIQCTANYTPANASNPNFIWRTSNNLIAAVSPAGLVTARTNGTVTITAHAYDGGAAFGQLVITVSNQSVITTGLNLTAATTNINTPNGFLQIQANPTPSNASMQQYVWTVSDASLAQITPDGRLQALANGVVTVSAATMDGSQITATISINITNQNIPIQTLSIQGTGGQNSITSTAGSLQMLATITPAAATNQNLIWRVDNEQIAAVTQAGLLVAKGNGTVQVSAFTQDGTRLTSSASIILSNQFEQAQSIVISAQGGQTDITTASGTLQMLAALTPNNSVAINWSVDDPNIATISPQGLLTAVADGQVVVIASAADGSTITDQISISISNQPIRIANISVQGQGGQSTISTNNGSLQMLATLTPAAPTNPNLVWSIAGGTGWANIDPSTGLLTASHNGTVVVRASAQENPLIFGEATITISGQPAGGPQPAVLSLSASASTISNPNGFLQMQYSLSPSNANARLSWAISPNTLATIDANGLLRATDNGVVTVTGTTINGIAANYAVTITNQYTPLVDLLIQGQGGQNQISILDASLQMEVSAISPSNATNTNVLWAVDNSAIASITPSGLLRAHRNGPVNVQAYAQDGSAVSAIYTVNITNQFLPIDSIQIQAATDSINVAWGLLPLLATRYPSTTTSQSVAWRVVNPAVASIDANGILQAHQNGVAYVIASAQDGSSAADTFRVYVGQQPTLLTSAQITAASSSINTPYGSLQLNTNHAPSAATNPNFYWRVDNPQLAMIDQQGRLIALNNGSVQAQILAQDGTTVQATYNTTITNQPVYITSLQIQGLASANSITTTYGSLQMEAINILPAGAAFTNLAWSVAQPSLADISPSGLLRAKANGTVTVQARSQDGSRLLATANITISNQPILIQTIALNPSARLISNAAGTAQFMPAVSPASTTNPTCRLVVSNPAMGNVNRYNMFTAVSNGLVYVRAYSQDGSGVVGLDSVLSINQHTSPSSLAVQGQGGQNAITSQNGLLQMQATAQPTPAPQLTYAWSVSPVALASINSSGKLIARQNGVVTVTAIAQDGSNATGSTTITIANQPTPINAINLTSSTGANTITTTNGSLQMLAAISPANATYTQIAWSVSNSNIATISTSGFLRARQNGVVSVVARSLDGTNITSSYSITITNQNISTTALSISGAGGINTITTPLGTRNMQASFTPTVPSNTNIYWQSSDPNLATIDHNGIVRAFRNGTVTITATTLDGSNLQASRDIIITNQPVFVASLQLNGTTTINQPFAVAAISAITNPSTANNGAVAFWVNNPNIISLNSVGQFRARRNGQARIYAVALDLGRVIDSIDIAVSNQLIFTQNIQISTPNAIDSIDTPNGSLQFAQSRIPAAPSNPNLYWSVDNPGIASIDQNGLLIAHSNGTVLVSLSAQDGSAQSASMLVRISNQNNAGIVFVEDIDVFAAASQINTPSGSLQISANIFPVNASNQNLLWSVSDGQRASIGNTGLLQGRADGSVLVFATSQDGSNISGIYAVSISNQPTSTQLINPIQLKANAYPNPFADRLRIEWQGGISKTNLWLCDAQGRPLQSMVLPEGTNHADIQRLADLPSGLYFVHILLADGRSATIAIRKI